MELTESINSINKQLSDLFGIDTITGQSIWRVSWANDQYEKRLTDITIEGKELMQPEVQLLPKYSYIRDRWILERLVLIPVVNMSELPTQKMSYECMWNFEDKYGNYLPPTVEGCKFVINLIYSAMGRSNMAKYVDEEAKNPIETREKRINKLVEELFGNETDTGDALAHHSGVGYTKPVKES
jgi:hypothetical protein